MTSAPRPQLIYFADAMCSWCYGFAPVIEAVRAAHPDLPIQLINGGLRPGTTKVMAEKDKAMIRSHWEHVHQASGQMFDFSLFERDDFIYDTEPAARAIVLVRNRDEAQALPFFHRVQSAFYAEGRDVTRAEVLADLATGFGFDRQSFHAAFAEEEAKVQAWTDFQVSQRTGVTGFPTLIAGSGAQEGWALITQGYQPAARVLSTIERWLAAQG
jgi:putative protein-disulfide isomerase